MKKFFSLVLALVMALSLTTVAWGATVEVNDYTTFTGAIADGNEIKLTADIAVTTGFTIPANTTVTIDLNGFKLYAGDASHTFSAAFTMITNKGTLTIKDGSTAKTGKIELAGEIRDANYDTYGFPTIAINAITNGGTLTLESGTISVTADKDATTPKVATYAVDNNSGTGNAILNINGGALINEHNVAIRQFCNSTTYKNEVNITAGEVTGTRAVWIQLPSSNSALEQKAALNVEGGTLTATGTSDGYNLAVYSYSYGASSTATEINISGGTFEGDVAIGGGAKNGSETMNITGGTFEGTVYTYNTDTTETAGKLEISGGTFAVAPDDALLADDLALVYKNGAYTTDEATNVAAVVNGVNYDNLQDAVDAAANGDTIVVKQSGVGAVVNWEISFTVTTVDGVDAPTIVADTSYRMAKTNVTDGVKYTFTHKGTGYTSTPNTPSTTTPSTTKPVQSAETFDAGIAMYVGMSVMAAAGSAVVIGKKKD